MTIANGTKQDIDGKPCIYYDGYWVRRYDVTPEDYAAKKDLIDKLTKRVFHHTEPGINAPGFRADELRRLYETETDPSRKRVKGAMLAGALLNRGADIMTAIVDLQEAGVKIEQGHHLLRESGKCFMEALQLGENIKLYSGGGGGEGLDELWGEPFKAFSLSGKEYYESRYIKIALTMGEIDKITNHIIAIATAHADFRDAVPLIRELGESAKLACETIRSDPATFEIWPRYVAAREALEGYIGHYYSEHEEDDGNGLRKIVETIRDGGRLLKKLTTIRVPLPESTKKFIERCGKLLDAQPK